MAELGAEQQNRPPATNAPAGLLLGMVGDVLVDRPDPGSAFDLVADVLAVPDAVFGNCEVCYCADPHPAITATLRIFPDPRNAEALRVFDVLSLANNHSLDGGHEGLIETILRLEKEGVQTVGAGRDIAAARQPAVISRPGGTAAFLAYSSVFPSGFEARPDSPGLAPMRADNHYLPGAPNYWYPGMAPRIITVPIPEDVTALEQDIRRAREAADIVVVGFHWGIFGQPHMLTDHEIRTAHFCIDSGADVVVGHHHHTLRGMELYKGKPIFYGLGHFVFDMSDPVWDDVSAKSFAKSYGFVRHQGWPLLQMHEDARMTALAAVRMLDGALTAGFLPCLLDEDGRVRYVEPESSDGRAIIAFVAEASASQGLATRFEVDDGALFSGYPAVQLAPPAG